jgi:hypothetical protein
MSLPRHCTNAVLLAFAISASIAESAWAGLYTLAASGTVTLNSSGDSTIPVGTPWSFELTYNTAAPDLDFELTSAPDPTFGRFKNTAAPPALTAFHYKAGSYEATLDDASDFGAFSDIHITFTSINAIDINIHAPTLFPQLSGAPVSFHADFNAFATAPVLSSDALPTDAALGQASFDESSVTLIPARGVVTSSVVTSFTVTAVVPEPAGALLMAWGAIGILGGHRWRPREGSARSGR